MDGRSNERGVVYGRSNEKGVVWLFVLTIDGYVTSFSCDPSHKMKIVSDNTHFYGISLPYYSHIN